MQSLDPYIVSLFVMHIIETSILVALTLKVFLHRRTISKIFFSKVFFLTALALFLIYLSNFVEQLIPIAIIQTWLLTISPLGILIVVFFIIRLAFIEQNKFSDYNGDRSLFISTLVLIILYLEVIIFNFDGYPTFIILLRIIFPLR